MDNPTLTKLIKDNGGVSKFAEKLGLKHNTVSEWKHRGWIPAWRAQQVSQQFDVPIEDVLPMTRRAPEPQEAA